MKTKWEFNAAINECLQRLGWNHFLHHFCADIGIQCTGLLDSRWVWIQQFQKVFKSLCIYINRIAAQLQQKISYSTCFFSGWFFSDQRAVFQIDHSSGTCLVHKKCIGHVLKISIHSFCLWTRQCLEVFKSLSNIHLENMSCVNNRCQTMKLLAWLHHVCVCTEHQPTAMHWFVFHSVILPKEMSALWNVETCLKPVLDGRKKESKRYKTPTNSNNCVFCSCLLILGLMFCCLFMPNYISISLRLTQLVELSGTVTLVTMFFLSH